MFGQRLRLARKRAGLSMRALAERITPKVTARTISKYEAGKISPSADVLAGISKALNVSLDFLTSTQVETLDGIAFRERFCGSTRDRARAEAILVDSLARYLTIEHILDASPDTSWLAQQRSDSIASQQEIDEAADTLRKAWHLGSDPIPSLCELLEKKGIKVIEGNLPERLDGLACHVLHGGKPVAEAILVSTRTNVERRRFTLARELAYRIICTTSKPSDSETASKRFAAAFLIPAQHLREQVGTNRQRTTYYEIMHLKHTYGVSATVMLRRLEEVGILPTPAMQHAFTTFARSWRKEEPEAIQGSDGFAAFEKPRRFQHLVLQAVGEKIISPARAADLLQQSSGFVEWQINGPSPQ